MTKLIFLTSLALVLIPARLSAQDFSQSEIYHSIRSGETSKIKQFLQAGLSPDARDSEGNTLLIRAAMYGTPELLKVLLEAGTDVNATNKAGATALMRAAGNYQKIELLVSKGAHVNTRSALGNTPLILAARAYPSLPAVKLLVGRGADVNATNNFGANAIMAASAAGDLEAVRFLLKHGADVNSHSRGSEGVVLWGGGRSPLMWASARGDLALMKLLLQAGAKVNEPEGFGNPLIQAAWMDQVDAARLLLQNGADVNGRDLQNGYTALHWAASSDRNDSTLVDLLIKHGADRNSEAGEQVDAFLGTLQTPLMLARKRGDTAITRSLAGAKVNAEPEKHPLRGERAVEEIDNRLLRLALNDSVKLLEATALESKKSFLNHSSKQQCVSCHQQYMPLVATAHAREVNAFVNQAAEQEMLALVKQDNAGLNALTAEATFHPEPGHSYGYALYALAAQKAPANPEIDSIVHHLLVTQGKEGQWHNNLPRPPIQTSDVAPTALAINALRAYGFPARQQEIDDRVKRARKWLRKVEAANTEELTFQMMGLAWAGESAEHLRKLSARLISEQRADGGWAQLATLDADAYATGQALVALRASGMETQHTVYQKGLIYLLRTQLKDGSWHVTRRAFPFQPTMRSGFPHSRDSWISATATSWAAIALAAAIEGETALHAGAH